MNVTDGYQPSDAIIRAEMVVVGEAISRPGALGELLAIVRPEWFYRQAHVLILAAAVRLDDRGDPVDPVSVMGELDRCGDLRKAGAAPYLHDCLAAAGPSAGFHARAVAADYRRRMLEAAGTRIAQMASEPDLDIETALDYARREVDAVPDALGDGGRPSFDQMLTSAILGLDLPAPPAIPTPWTDLNFLLSIRPGSLTIVGARPAVGKSVVLASMAAFVAMKLGRQAVIFSLEMSAEELTLRLLSAEARIPLDSLMHHRLADGDWDRLERARKDITGAPLLIIDDPGITLAGVRSVLRDQRRAGEVALAGIDYLGLVNGGAKPESRQQEVAELSRGCKRIAREFDVPLIVAAQLNRNSEHRADRRPTLSDLRESGAIEADADNVILLHREDVIERESPRAGEIDLIVAKQRMGPISTVTAAFQGHYSRVVDMARPWSPSAGATS